MISNIFTVTKLDFRISDLFDRVHQSKRALNICHCLLYLYTYGGGAGQTGKKPECNGGYIFYV